MQPTLQEIDKAAAAVYPAVVPTPQFCWPQLCEQLGAEVWVKHENHTCVGAFKVRGGLAYFADLAARRTPERGVVAATRGNHGQSIAFAARRHGLTATIVVPHGNSREKNAAMRALGAELIEHGDDFQAAKECAERLAGQRSLHMVPSYHPLLVAGVATYCLELLRNVRDLDTVYVPIGLGSGIAAMIAARDALGLRTRIVGVVSSHARAYAASFEQRRPVASPSSTRLADGMACRTPERAALEVIWKGVDRIVEVTDAQVGEAMRTLFECTHNVAEGAGAAALAAATQERVRNAGRRIAVTLSGGNVDRDLFSRVLDGSFEPPETGPSP